MHSKNRRSSILANVGLAVSACALMLVVAEVAIRMFVTVRNVGPPVSAYDPVYGVRLKRDFDGVQVTPEFRMHITTNSRGFRSPELVDSDRDVLLYLGDSFTVGFGVSDGQEFPAVVAQRIADGGAEPVPYINAGRGNSGQGHWVKFLRREAEMYDPQIIVLQVLENDLRDNIREGLFRVDAADSLVELPVRGPGINRILEALVSRLHFVANSHLFGLVRQAYYELSTARVRTEPVPGGSDNRNDSNTSDRSHVSGDLPPSEEETRLLLRLLDEAGRICNANGWQAVALRVALDSYTDARVDSVFSAHGIRSERIPSRKDMPELYYEIDGHWNARGHAYAADVVLRLLAAVDPVRFGGLGLDHH